MSNITIEPDGFKVRVSLVRPLVEYANGNVEPGGTVAVYISADEAAAIGSRLLLAAAKVRVAAEED